MLSAFLWLVVNMYKLTTKYETHSKQLNTQYYQFKVALGATISYPISDNRSRFTHLHQFI